MALTESAVSKLLDAFHAGDGVDLIRDGVTVLQELLRSKQPSTSALPATNAPKHG